MIGDFLYGLTARDQQVTPLQVIRARWHQEGAVNAVLLLRPPQGFALLIDYIWFRVTASLALIGEYSIYISDPQSAFVPDVMPVLIRRTDQAASVVEESFIFSRPLIVDSRDAGLRFDVLFTVADGGNITDFALFGTLIPVGNLSLGDVILGDGSV